MNDSVSVIIPTYNRPQGLHRAIDSVLCQTISPLEILVCEDGATSQTEKVVTSFNDSRVKWLPGDHSGRPAIPRNRGIQAAQGDWLAFLDDDDVWMPAKLEKQLVSLKEKSLLACCSNAWKVQSNSGQIKYFESGIPSKMTFTDLINTNYVICSSMIFRRSIVTQTGGFPEQDIMRGIEDYALWLKIAAITDFSYLKEPLLEYTDAPETSIRNNSKTPEDQKNEVFQEFINWSASKSKTGKLFKIKCELFLLKHPKLFLVRVITHIRWRLTRNK